MSFDFLGTCLKLNCCLKHDQNNVTLMLIEANECIVDYSLFKNVSKEYRI